MDESNPTCNKRFAKLEIPQTEEARRAYRELIVTTPGLAESISSAILYDETVRQQKKDGTPFAKALVEAGIIPGIKVDTGAKEMAGHPGEKVPEGLERARLTCKLVALNGVPEIEPDLVEWNYGDYEGKKSVNIRRERPDWDVFRDGCPHGEMPAQVLARADRLIARLRMLDGNVALFSHGQFGGVLGARWIGIPLENARHLPLGTASVSTLGYDPEHPEVPVISLWNYLSHPFSHSVQPPPSGQTMKQRAIQRWENEGGEIPVGGSKPSSLVQVPLLMP